MRHEFYKGDIPESGELDEKKIATVYVYSKTLEFREYSPFADKYVVPNTKAGRKKMDAFLHRCGYVHLITKEH